MALQVWLPLNGDLKNRGLADITVTNNGAVVDNNGKIGKCYRFTKTAHKYYNFKDITSTVTNNHSFSICGWINTDSPDGAICSLSYGVRLHPRTFAIMSSNKSFYLYNPVNCWDSKWHHIAGTYNIVNGVAKFYVDGVCTATDVYENYSSSWSNGSYIGVDINNSSADSCCFNGLLNDLRIYDHCLSAKEVKEISKGLVLHYKLDDEYVESTANLGNTSIDYHNMTYGTVYAASSWGGDAGTCTFYPNGGYNNYPYKVYHKTATGTGGIFKKTANDITIVAGKTYTMSVYVKASRNFTEGSHSFNINGVAGSDTNHYIQTGRVNFTTDWQRLVYTFTAGNADAGTYGEMSIIYNDEATDYYVCYSGFQIEEGNHATPFVNGSRNNTIVYDCSGYGYDGTVGGSLSVNADSPRYSCATVNNSTSSTINITAGNFNIPDGPCTLSFWSKPIDNTTVDNSKLTIRFANMYYFTYINYPYFYHDGSQNYKYTNYWSDGKWHFVTCTYDGTSLRLYIDGVYINNASTGSSDTESKIHKTNLVIGNRGNNLSDFRIYSTALSDADVLELYNTSAKITKNGTLMCYEIKED